MNYKFLYYWVLLIFMILFGQCSKPNLGVRIDGEIETNIYKKAYLVAVNLTGVELLDSVEIRNDKKFLLFNRKVNYDQLLSVVFNKNNEILLINDVPRISITENRKTRNWLIRGSEASTNLQIFVNYFNRFDKKIEILEDSLLFFSSQKEKQRIVENTRRQEIALMLQYLPSIIKKISHPAIAFYILGRISKYCSINDLIKYNNLCINQFGNYAPLNQFNIHLNSLKRDSVEKK